MELKNMSGEERVVLARITPPKGKAEYQKEGYSLVTFLHECKIYSLFTLTFAVVTVSRKGLASSPFLRYASSAMFWSVSPFLSTKVAIFAGRPTLLPADALEDIVGLLKCQLVD